MLGGLGLRADLRSKCLVVCRPALHLASVTRFGKSSAAVSRAPGLPAFHRPDACGLASCRPYRGCVTRRVVEKSQELARRVHRTVCSGAHRVRVVWSSELYPRCLRLLPGPCPRGLLRWCRALVQRIHSLETLDGICAWACRVPLRLI
jgi:hypothetical protein